MATAELIQGNSSGPSPERVGRFVLQSEIGRGRMGPVYKATDSKSGNTVAVRLVYLNRFGVDPQDARARLLQAARAASTLDCPNMVTVSGGGDAPELFYVTLEYICGATLQQRMRNGEKIGVSEFLDIARQMCAALDHAHSHKVYHGNLTPWNVIFEMDGTLKIMDYGLARSLVAKDTNEDFAYVPFLAPEVLRGGNPDARSDLFSAASILYQALTGKKPFPGDTREEIAQNVLDGAAPPAHDSSIMIHPGLSAVLGKALSRNPQERYQSGAEFVRELENYKSLGGKAVTPAPPAMIVERFPAPPPVAARVPTPPPMMSPATPRVPMPPPMAPAEIKVKAAPTPRPAPAPVVARPVAQAANPKRNAALLVALVVLVVIALALWKTRARDMGSVTVTPAETASEPVAAPEKILPAAPAAPKTNRVRPAARAAVPEPAAPSAGELVVSATPAGVGAQIDGGPTFMTPYTQSSVTPGMHTVIFSKAGYVSESRSIQVVAGSKAMVAVTLQAQGAFVIVHSTPAGATVLVDGKESGTTPAKLTLSEGQHAITVRKDGYLAQSTTPTLSRGQEFLFSPELMAAGTTTEIKTVGKFKKMFGGSGQEMGMVEVKSTPKGAEITVNGQKVSKLAPVSFMLNPGNYEIQLQMDGYRAVKRTISVQKGDTVRVEEQLVR